ALRDHSHVSGARQRQAAVDRVLIRDVDRRLQGIEASAFDGVAGGVAVATVADVARPAALARALQRLDGLALPELAERAAVKLDEVDVVGREAAQAALDAGQEGRAPPVGARPTAGVPALREQRDLPPAGPERLADQALAVVVALRRVEHVQPGVEGAPEQPRDRARAHALVADLGAAEAEHARHDVGPAELSPLHDLESRLGLHPGSGRRGPSPETACRAHDRRRHGPSRYHSPVARVTRARETALESPGGRP